MSTITIERIPKAGGASTTKTLAEWGLAPGSMESAAWVVGTLTLVARGASPAFSDPVFEYLDTLKVYEDSTCIWWGPVISTGSTVQPAEQRTYTVADPMWWAQWAEFRYPYTPEPEMIETKRGKVWLTWALNRAASLYPIGYVAADLGDLSVGTAGFAVPCPDLRSSANCLEVIQRVARLHPLSSQWWELSGETPLLRCALRTGLAAVSLARSRCQEPLTLTPLPEKQLTAVWLEYVYTDSFGNRSAADNQAGTAPYTGPNTLHAAMKVGTDSADDGYSNYDLAHEAQQYHIAEMLYATWASLPWAGTLTIVGTPDLPLPAIRPGQLLNLTGGRTEWASMAAQVQRVSRTIGETCDRMQVELGCGEHLGPTDLLSLARTGVTSGGAAGGNPSPFEPPAPPSKPTPGTYDDLNGGTGGGTPEGIIAVQTRGGNWSLDGYSSFDGSAPSRRWLRVDMAYSVTYDCGGSGGQGTSTRSAYGVYDPANFAAGAHGENLTALNGWSASQYFCSEPFPYVKSVTTATATATPGTYVSTGSCCGSQNPYTLVSGSDVQTLSSEYTADDAIARLLASSPEWTDSLTAIRTIPTSGITGVYREMRYRTEHAETSGQQILVEGQWVAGAWVPGYYRTASTSTTYPTLTGLSPWGRYCVTVPLESRPVDEAGAPTGDGTWSEAGTRQHYFVADIEGVGGFDWQIIEPTAGYETRIGTPLVEVA